MTKTKKGPKSDKPFNLPTLCKTEKKEQLHNVLTSDILYFYLARRTFPPPLVPDTGIFLLKCATGNTTLRYLR